MNQSTIDFETIVLNEISKAWHRFVRDFKWSGSGITSPAFRIFDRSSRWGQWSPSTREMSFSRSLINNRPWSEVLEVLKHEMAHQYVSEVLHMDNEEPHGATFQSVCKQNKIDAAPRGTPGADKIDAPNHIVEKIRHLLALAKSDNENESKLAAETAHSMMLKYNLDVAEKNEERNYTVRYVGKITGRIQGYMSSIADLLSKFYFVQIIWMPTYDPRSKKKGHELEVSGTMENVEVAEYVFDFLTRSALAAWERKLASPEYKKAAEDELFYSHQWGGSKSKIGYAITARYNFLLGFISGFKAQLKQAEVKEQSEGLVLAKDPALEAFYHDRHPSIRKLTSGGGKYNSNMRNDGFAEGNSLRMPPAAKSGKKFVPLLNK